MKLFVFGLIDCCLGMLTCVGSFLCCDWLVHMQLEMGNTALMDFWSGSGPALVKIGSLFLGSTLTGYLFYRHHGRPLLNVICFNPGVWLSVLFMVLSEFDYRTNILISDYLAGRLIDWHLWFEVIMPWLGLVVVMGSLSAAGVGLGRDIGKQCHSRHL
jgi:hypothetical protein